MFRLRHFASVAALAFVCAGTLHANDLIVNQTGANGTFTTISAAMSASNPGDRILVYPGTYPDFHFHRGVQVIGMGASPNDVIVSRVDYHPTVPNIHYQTLLSNLTIESTSPMDAIGLSGNELAPGTLVLDTVIINSGVYLVSNNATTGFYLLMSNCSVAPSAGEGFANAAVTVGGKNNFVEIVNSRITGWNSSPANFTPAGIALNVKPGTTIKIDGSDVRGGNGIELALYGTGAHGVTVASSQSATTIVLSGGTTIQGGTGEIVSAGGHGIAGSNNLSVHIGSVIVNGGFGNPPGNPIVAGEIVVLSVDPHLSVTPNLQFASGAIGVNAGQTLTYSMATPFDDSVIAISAGLTLPSAPYYSPLVTDPTLVIIAGNVLSLDIPIIPTLQGIELFATGGAILRSGEILVTQTTAIRIDFTLE